MTMFPRLSPKIILSLNIAGGVETKFSFLKTHRLSTKPSRSVSHVLKA